MDRKESGDEGQAWVQSDLQVSVRNLRLPGRQSQILLKLAVGDSTGEIAYDLGISVNTVKEHIKRMHRRLDVHSRAELLAVLYRCRIGSARPASPPYG